MTGTLDGSLSLERCLPICHLPIFLIVNLNFGDSEKFERTFNLLKDTSLLGLKQIDLREKGALETENLKVVVETFSKYVSLNVKAFEDFSFSRT